MNFLQETKDAIQGAKHTASDIVFIGSMVTGHYVPSWRRFCKLADFNYDDGYGDAAIAEDLVIVFSDGVRLERREYDGSEWWEHVHPFKMPVLSPQRVTNLRKARGYYGGSTLQDLQEGKPL